MWCSESFSISMTILAISSSVALAQYSNVCPGRAAPVRSCQLSNCPSNCYCYSNPRVMPQRVCCPQTVQSPAVYRPAPVAQFRVYQQQPMYLQPWNYNAPQTRPYPRPITTQFPPPLYNPMRPESYTVTGNPPQAVQPVLPSPYRPKVTDTGSLIKTPAVAEALKAYRDAVREQIQRYPVLMYSSARCSYCIASKKILNDEGIPYYYIDYDVQPGGVPLIAAVQAETGRDTVPVIFICGNMIGDKTALEKIQRTGELVRRVKQCAPDAIRTNNKGNNKNNDGNNNNMDKNNPPLPLPIQPNTDAINNNLLMNGFVEVPYRRRFRPSSSLPPSSLDAKI